MILVQVENNSIWRASAPSNIALIKYMGKKTDAGVNQATNSSLSYTLNHLRSFVQLKLDAMATKDHWAALNDEKFVKFEGSQQLKLARPEFGLVAQQRFLKHFENLKKYFGVEANFEIQSANAFPSDCGLASSASSFAALTLAAAKALGALSGKEDLNIYQIAELSRQGSGSSCRSFFDPWALWKSEKVQELDLPVQNLWHQVVVVDDQIKKVSSSEAHKRVTSSSLFEGRIERAELRLQNLVEAFNKKSWHQAYQLCWSEFWDMQALFETSQPHFGYLSAGSMDILRFVQENTWEKTGDGPLITMDAGPNVHLLYREDQRDLAEKLQLEFTPMNRVYANYDISKF